jgi:hypothetical protein
MVIVAGVGICTWGGMGGGYGWFQARRAGKSWQYFVIYFPPGGGGGGGILGSAILEEGLSNRIAFVIFLGACRMTSGKQVASRFLASAG